MPTSQKQDPLVCAAKLGKYVLENNLDGCDIDWEDNDAMERGEGEQWLIDFTKALRELLPTHVITHAPQAPYFKKEYYKNGGYVTVHKSVGSLINFYNVQFYNQGDSKYDTYDELFINAHGKFSNTSV
jgi:chitinase